MDEEGFTEIEVDLDDEHVAFIESLVAEQHAAGNTEATFSTVICDLLKKWLDENEG